MSCRGCLRHSRFHKRLTKCAQTPSPKLRKLVERMRFSGQKIFNRTASLANISELSNSRALIPRSARGLCMSTDADVTEFHTFGASETGRSGFITSEPKIPSRYEGNREKDRRPSSDHSRIRNV